MFLAKIPVTLHENDVQPILEMFGEVEKIILFRANPRDARTKACPCCGSCKSLRDTMTQALRVLQQLVSLRSHAAAAVGRRPSKHCCLQGCGIVTMARHEDAAAAIEALDKVHRFPGSDTAVVAKWVDQQLQQKRPRRAAEAQGGPSTGTHAGWEQFSWLRHASEQAPVGV